MFETHVASALRNLQGRNFHQFLSDSRRIGRLIKKEWDAKLFQEKNKTAEKYKFTSNPVFKEFLVTMIDGKSNTKTAPTYINELKSKLSDLALFLMIWKDDPYLSEEFEIEQSNLSKTEKKERKKLRQLIKYKSSLDKDDRYAINIALQTMAFILCQQSNNFIKQEEKTTEIHAIDFEWKNSINFFKRLNNKQKLIQYISIHIKKLNKFAAYQSLSINEESPLNRQEIEKMGEAIAAFQTSNKKKKFLKYAGILLAFIAALACGISIGAAIILLFPTLSITAFILGGLITLFGFTANFGFFSKNFPDFILNLVKKGGISEYIDIDGNRKQFSRTYKYLLTPLLTLASLTVGAGTTALTYITILGLIGKLLPILAIIWPPLPLIIVGVLAVAVGIALTVATLTASLELLKKVAALNMNLKELSHYTYKNCIEWFKNLKNLKTHEKLGLVIMLVLLPVGLAGLAYYRYTAGVDLSIFIGITGAIVMGIVAYIAQMAFICLSINKLKNALIKPFSSTATQQAMGIPLSKSLLSRAKSFFSNIWYTLGLSINALGNSVLVYDGSSVSVAGAVACGVNSFSGNMLKPDKNQQKRKTATKALINEIENFNTRKEDESELADNSNNLEAKQLKSSSNPLYPNNNSLPSPTKSESEFTATMNSSFWETQKKEDFNPDEPLNYRSGISVLTN